MLAKLVEKVIHLPKRRKLHRLLTWIYRFADNRFVKSRYGVVMKVYSQDWTNFACVTGYPGTDYDDVFEHVSQLRPGEAFIDIGANAGLFSLVAAKQVSENGRVVSFEPSMRIFSRLVENIAQNGQSNIFPFRLAIGQTTGMVSFFEGTSEHTGVSHVSPDGPNSVLQSDYQDIRNLISEIIGNRTTLIKIDVEGYEQQVLATIEPMFSDMAVKKVIAEVNDEHLRRFSGSSQDLYDIMDRNGFKAIRGIGSKAHYNEIFVRP